MAKTARNSNQPLRDTQEIESFLHTFLKRLPAGLKPGEDVTRYAKKVRPQDSSVLERRSHRMGRPGAHDEGLDARTQALVLSQPGQADALGLTIKCVTIRGWRFCLECGWLYCRIVVTKRF